MADNLIHSFLSAPVVELLQARPLVPSYFLAIFSLACCLHFVRSCFVSMRLRLLPSLPVTSCPPNPICFNARRRPQANAGEEQGPFAWLFERACIFESDLVKLKTRVVCPKRPASAPLIGASMKFLIHLVKTETHVVCLDSLCSRLYLLTSFVSHTSTSQTLKAYRR